MAREDYPLYVHWYETLDTILNRAEAFPRNARFSLGGRVADAGLDVMEGIVRAIYTQHRPPLLAEVSVSRSPSRYSGWAPRLLLRRRPAACGDRFVEL